MVSTGSGAVTNRSCWRQHNSRASPAHRPPHASPRRRNRDSRIDQADARTDIAAPAVLRYRVPIVFMIRRGHCETGLSAPSRGLGQGAAGGADLRVFRPGSRPGHRVQSHLRHPALSSLHLARRTNWYRCGTGPAERAVGGDAFGLAQPFARWHRLRGSSSHALSGSRTRGRAGARPAGQPSPTCVVMSTPGRNSIAYGAGHCMVLSSDKEEPLCIFQLAAGSVVSRPAVSRNGEPSGARAVDSMGSTCSISSSARTLIFFAGCWPGGRTR